MRIERFEEFNETRSEQATTGLTKLYSQHDKETRSPEERLEEVEDILTDVTDQWPLMSTGLSFFYLSKNPEVLKNPIDRNQMIYRFKLKPKFSGYMHPIGGGTWGSGYSKDYYNSDIR